MVGNTLSIAQWSVVDPTDSRAGSLLAWYQISRTLGSLNTSEFMHEAGAVSPVNGGDTAPGDYRDLWQMLAWEQWILDNKLRIGAGKLTTRTFLNLNRYAVSDREDFFSPMLVNNPVAPFAARNGMIVLVLGRGGRTRQPLIWKRNMAWKHFGSYSCPRFWSLDPIYK